MKGLVIELVFAISSSPECKRYSPESETKNRLATTQGSYAKLTLHWPRFNPQASAGWTKTDPAGTTINTP